MDAKNKASREPHVSIVDDDVSVRRSTRRLLRCCGLRAELLSSAEDFLQSGRVAETSCLCSTRVCQEWMVWAPLLAGMGLRRLRPRLVRGRNAVAEMRADEAL